jgi:hypothetical protein
MLTFLKTIFCVEFGGHLAREVALFVFLVILLIWHLPELPYEKWVLLRVVFL